MKWLHLRGATEVQKILNMSEIKMFMNFPESTPSRMGVACKQNAQGLETMPSKICFSACCQMTHKIDIGMRLKTFFFSYIYGKGNNGFNLSAVLWHQWIGRVHK